MHESLILLLAALVPLASSLWWAWHQQQGRLRLLEYTLDMLQRQTGIEPLQALRQECMPLMQANRSREAIRLFRQRTGADQPSAREQIKAWMAQVAADMAGAALAH